MRKWYGNDGDRVVIELSLKSVSPWLKTRLSFSKFNIHHVWPIINGANRIQRKRPFENRDFVKFIFSTYVLALIENITQGVFLTKVDPTLFTYPPQHISGNKSRLGFLISSLLNLISAIRRSRRALGWRRSALGFILASIFWTSEIALQQLSSPFNFTARLRSCTIK